MGLMAGEYVARDPRTGKRIGRTSSSNRSQKGIAALTPERGPWQNIPLQDIIPLAIGKEAKIEVLTDGKKLTLGRIDAIKALHKVSESDAENGYEALVEALEDDFPDVRIAALKSMPSFVLRRQGILFHCLSDRLSDEVEAVSEEL